MIELTDFQIIQRDSDGYARVPFFGIVEREITEDTSVYARVVREDDNMTVVGWEKCELNGNNWSTELCIPEGGLYRFEACIHLPEFRLECCDRIKCIYHVGVGDIYVLAGQSNMTGYGRDSAYDPACLGVHSFAHDGKWCIAVQPITDSLGTVFGNAENSTGSSPALSFARRLKERLGIPIGIVPTAVGGSPLSEWHPKQAGNFYQAMMKRIEMTGKIKGILWFQGCTDANANDAENYFERFSEMIELWRKEIGNVPVLTVQLNRWVGNNNDQADKWWGIIRDAQRKAALEIEDVYVVPSLDLPVTDGIHNSSGANVIIGERLANTALACLYGKTGQTAPSVISAEAIDSTHLRVNITPGYNVLPMDNFAMGMNVEDETGIIECIDAIPCKDGFEISTARNYSLPAKYHSSWRCQPPVFVPRDVHGMPLLACYGIEILPKSSD